MADPKRYETRHGLTSEVISVWPTKGNAMAAARALRRRSEHGYYVFDVVRNKVTADFLPLKRNR